MCGIAGIVDYAGGIDRGALERMLAALRHRGPDGEGEAAAEFCRVGMRRLSIIDIGGGQQPIYNEDRSVFVVLNGEIYNFRELRAELESRGHRFATQTDTEVLVHLYEDHGIDFVQRLNGMFAFALVDLRARKLHLVRDRLGIKPLYYAMAGGRCWFASELRALLSAGIERGALAPDALARYFTFLCVPTPDTPFRNIRKLAAGSRLEIREQGSSEARWWRLADHMSKPSAEFGDASAQLRSLTEDAVRLQLRADVPVGASLSGGVDSSIVTALAARHHPQKLDTFFVAFAPAEFDERPFARLVAERCGTRHHEIEVSADEAVRELPALAAAFDEPIGDAAALPTYLVSRLAARHVKVCLSGLGGDELFGGYPRHWASNGRLAQAARWPAPLRSLLRLLLSAFDQGRTRTLDWWIANPARWQAYLRVLRQTVPEQLEALFPARGMESAIGGPVLELFATCPQTSEANRRMFVDTQLYMNDQLLQMSDRMSMACSLELRVPLIDHRIVELAAGMPEDFKRRGRLGKRILQSAFADLIPREIFARPKYGFGPPHHLWASTPAFAALRERAARGRLVADGVLPAREIDELLRPGQSMAAPSNLVWMLVCLELWYDGMFSPPATAERVVA